MKKKTVILVMGLLLGLTACGKQTVSEAPVEQEAGAAEAGAEQADAVDMTENAASMNEQTNYVEDMVLSTDLFTITIPEEFKGKFLATIEEDGISIYDKASNEAGFGGFAFSVVADKDGNITPGGMFVKVGELSTPEGDYYNVCMSRPSDVQWDYTKSEEMPEDYKKLYDSADTIIEAITANGGGTYMYKAGTQGKDLYAYTLTRYIDAVRENWDANKLEEEGMSPEIYYLSQSDGEKALDEIGFAYKDISNDGIDELLIGFIEDGNGPSMLSDIYTMVDRSPAHVVTGTARDRYYALTYGGIANEGSGGADETVFNVYEIMPNSTELMHQYSFKYDGYTDEKNPWFVSYGTNEDDWEPMTEDDFNERMKMLQDEYIRVEFTPLSELAPIDYSKVDLSKYGTFTEMLSDFKTGMGYANVKLGDTDVFLASSGTYNGENDTKNAMDSSIFMYDDKGAIVYLGQVASSGTAYPVSIADGCLFTGGHHNVFKTTVKDGKLVTVEQASETFDTDANATYYYATEKDGEQKVSDDTNLLRMFDEYAEAVPVEFSVEKP